MAVVCFQVSVRGTLRDAVQALVKAEHEDAVECTDDRQKRRCFTLHTQNESVSHCEQQQGTLMDRIIFD